MRTRPTIKMLSVLLFGLTSAVTAHANPVVTDWSYSLSGVWTSYAPVAGINLSGDSKTLSWGTPAVVGGGVSSLVITDPAAGVVSTQISGDSPQPGSTAAGVTLTHNNNPIFAPSLSSAVLSVSLNLTATTPLDAVAVGGGPGPLPALVYNILFIETTNSTPCVAPSPAGNPCNDIFVQATGFLDQVLPYNGNNYFINIFPTTGGVLSTLSSAECAAAGVLGGGTCQGFTTVEGASTSLAFGFTISTERFNQEVPEPGILALLGIGLAAGAFSRRRRV